MAAALPFALGIGGSLLGKLIGGGSKKADPAPLAAPAAPAVMPTPDDAGIQQARKRSIIMQMSRHGRDSTMLAGNKLGG